VPLDPSKLGERNYRRQFKLMNRVGQLGRQGVHGPVEKSEKRILNAHLAKSKATTKKRTSKG
jgi:hypothetical protein